MSTFDYTRSKASADRLIARYGMAATLRRPGAATGPAYDPTPGTPEDHPCVLVVLKFSAYDVANSQGRVLATDKMVLLAKGTLPFDPLPSDKLVIGGVEHRIIGPSEGNGIQTIAPGGVVVLYQLQCRI